MEWKIDSAPVVYETAIAFMEERVALIRAGTAPECVWLLEHPPLFTAGTGANAGDLLDTLGFPVIATGRGGQYTYHGPGQRVAYVMLDLKRRGADVRAYVQRLEAWIIQALAGCGIKGVIREGRVGVWVETPLGEAKIAAIGVRVRQWVTYHGIAINIAPDLSHYRGIVPCGIKEHGVTSLEAMGIKITMVEFDGLLRQAFDTLFGM